MDLAPGYRLMAVQGLYRLLPDSAGRKGASTRVYPYVGVGAGVVRPDFESLTGRQHAGDDGIAGTALRGLAGLSLRLTPRTSLYGEYSLDYVDDSLGTIPVSPGLKSYTSRMVFGVKYSLR